MHSDQGRNRRFQELTLRRVEILGLVEQQYSQLEIAQHLDISTSTVHTHVRQLEALFECESMPELGRRWASVKDEWLRYAARLANVRTAE